jgi:hypothetical protein
VASLHNANTEVKGRSGQNLHSRYAKSFRQPFSTPENSAGGYLAGMSLAMLTGRAPEAISGRLVLRPVPGRRLEGLDVGKGAIRYRKLTDIDFDVVRIDALADGDIDRPGLLSDGCSSREAGAGLRAANRLRTRRDSLG